MDIIVRALEEMGAVADEITVLREKDGILIARVKIFSSTYILKCLLKEEYRREAENYQLLYDLEIPTVELIALSDWAILMKDLTCSEEYRLGEEKDLSDINVAKALAHWYRQLHQKGAAAVKERSDLYDESDLFTRENLAFIKEKTDADLPCWSLLEEHFSEIENALAKLPRTLAYNDFYYTNLAVAKDCSSALMFDYNLMGKGYVYADLRNVTSSLSEEAGEAFLAEYGGFDPLEAAVDALVSPVTTLVIACQREVFPVWGKAVLQELQNGMEEKFARLQALLKSDIG